MKNAIRIITAHAVLMLTFITAPALAQTTAASSPGGAPSTASDKASRTKKHADFVEKRIEQLHTQMKITEQQSPQWDAFAQVMRDNAQKTAQAFQDRAQKLPSLNADDSMKSYAALAQLHADNMEKLAAAFSSLYGVLSDEQKKVADSLFRHEQGKRHPLPPKHKHAAPDGAATSPG